jgi:hypothetical protein
MENYDTMPWYIAVPVSAALVVAYLIIRHKQDKKENR